MATQKIADLPLTGASGRVYAFNVYPLETTFAAYGGVYAISRRGPQPPGSGLHLLKYVGQTGNLSTRFADHHKEVCWQRQLANARSILWVADEATRLEIEADLIAAYDPPCNG